MHKFVSSWFLTVAVLLVPAAAAAQEEGKVGITMGFPEHVGLVWHATEKLAVRPEFAFSTSSSDSEFAESSADSFSAGVSALYYFDRRDRLATYVSPRYAFKRSSTTIDGEGPFGGEEQESSSRTHLFSGSFGAQYWLNERFSVFGELGLAYQHGSAGDDDDDLPGEESTANAFGTRSAVGIVFYF